MMRSGQPEGEYEWGSPGSNCSHEYLLPELRDVLNSLRSSREEEPRVLDLGCGNGFVTGWLAARGFQPLGVDPSSSGIQQARSAHPELEFHEASAYDPLREELGSFSIVVSLEVVEHLYDPRRFARTVFDVLRPGGTAIISTPYHGWLKNVAIAVLDKFDEHVNPLRVHGHIKFWSPDTLSALLDEAGLQILGYRFAGRVRPLAKSMMAVAEKPLSVEDASLEGDAR